MFAGLIVFVILAMAVIIWIAWREPTLSYVTITGKQLRDPTIWDETTIIIEVATTDAAFLSRDSSDALCVRRCDLQDVLKWIPSRTTLVFCSKDEIRRLHSRTEQILLTLGINVVFWLIGDASVTNDDGTVPFCRQSER